MLSAIPTSLEALDNGVNMLNDIAKAGRVYTKQMERTAKREVKEETMKNDLKYEISKAKAEADRATWEAFQAKHVDTDISSPEYRAGLDGILADIFEDDTPAVSHQPKYKPQPKRRQTISHDDY